MNLEENFFILNNGKSFLKLDLNKGGKIKECCLFSEKHSKSISCIKSESDNHLSDGSYLMYPWVNRLNSVLTIESKSINAPFKDGKGLPLHGLYASTKRKIISQSETSIKIACENYYEEIPYFEEEFILTADKLQINTYFFPDKNKNYSKGFGYGYHPYLRYDGKSLDGEDFLVRTNLSHVMKVDSNLLPEQKKYVFTEVGNLIPVLKNKFDSNSKKLETNLKDLFLDNCLIQQEEKNSFFEIVNKNENIGILLQTNNSFKVEEFSTIPLKYLQIYTPDEKKSVAVEPQSICTDAFFIENSDLTNDLSKKYVGSFTIQLVSY